MQQLKVEQKKATSNKIVSSSEETIVENKREVRGRHLSTSRKIYRLQNTDVYYVQSESSNDIYYYVKYNFDAFEYCSCPDNSIKGQKCKHQFVIEHSIRLGTLKDIDKLPAEAKRYPATTAIEAIAAKSYRDDNYDF